MSQIAKSTQPYTLVLGRPGRVPVQLRIRGGNPVNALGYLASARFTWTEGGRTTRGRQVQVTDLDLANGSMILRWTAIDTYDLPAGKGSARLVLTIGDTIGQALDVVVPLVCEVP